MTDRIEAPVAGDHDFRGPGRLKRPCHAVVDAVGPARFLVPVGNLGRHASVRSTVIPRRLYDWNELAHEFRRIGEMGIFATGAALSQLREPIADHVSANRGSWIRERPVDDAGRDAGAAQDSPQGSRPDCRRGMAKLGEQAVPNHTVGKTEVRQKTNRIVATLGHVDPGGPDAIFLGKLTGRDRRPHRRRGCRVKGGQMDDGARIEHSAEVRKPALGGGSRDELERTGVDRDDRDVCRVERRGGFERRVERPRIERRDQSVSRKATGSTTDVIAMTATRRPTPL